MTNSHSQSPFFTNDCSRSKTDGHKNHRIQRILKIHKDSSRLWDFLKYDKRENRMHQKS